MGNILKKILNVLKRTEPNYAVYFPDAELDLEMVGGNYKNINKRKRGRKKTHKRLRNLKQKKRTNKRVRKSKIQKHINKTTKRKYSYI